MPYKKLSYKTLCNMENYALQIALTIFNIDRQYNFEIWLAFEALNPICPFIQIHTVGQFCIEHIQSSVFTVWVQKRDGERWLAHLA